MAEMLNIYDSFLKQIEEYEPRVEAVEIGFVKEIGDGIARVSGLGNVRFNELVTFSNGTQGIAFNLESDNVGVIIMSDYGSINEGDEVRPQGRIASVPVGRELVGRVVNALGEPIDGKGPIATSERYNIERIAPGVMERQSVNRPVQTGIMAIDAMLPLIPSSTRKGKACSVFMSQLASVVVKSLVWWQRWKKMAQWNIPSL